jgi:hypothetical protein
MTFYCCEWLQEESEDKLDGWSIKDLMDIFDWKFCPKCGFKLSMLR